MLKDETKTGFKLVIDGYLQNEQAVNKLNLQNLSVGKHDLIFLMDDGEKLRRKIELDRSSHYQYVLHRNFRGARKLRYRGSYSKLSQNAMVLDFNTKTEYQDLRESIAVVDSLSHYPKTSAANLLLDEAETTLTENDTAAQTSLVATEISTKPTETKDSVIVTEINTTEPVEIEDRQATAYSALQKSIKLNDFEFDKIQMIEEFLQSEAISASQLVSLLQELKYDQSRLQILKIAASKQPDLKKDKELFLSTLDYELSKQKANSFFL